MKGISIVSLLLMFSMNSFAGWLFTGISFRTHRYPKFSECVPTVIKDVKELTKLKGLRWVEISAIGF